MKFLKLFFGTGLLVSILVMFFNNASSAYAHVAIPTSPTTPCNMIDSTDLTTHVSNQVDNRLASSSPNNSLALYTNRNDAATTSAIWTRNPNVWTSQGTPIDFTGVMGWNDNAQYNKGAALITPRHFITAAHYAMPVGTHVVFYDSSGNPVVRQITGAENVSGTDIEVEALDNDVPDSITYYPILASSTLYSLLYKYIPQTTDVPIVVFNANAQALVHSLYDVESNYLYHQPYRSGSRSPYSTDVIVGDSGQPAFIIIDGRPVFLFSNYTAISGPDEGNYIANINSAINDLGSNGYQVSVYNPTCFTQYATNHIPVFNNPTNLFINQSAFSTSTVLRTFNATDADVGQTLTYSLIGLSSKSTTSPMTASNYFSINSSTGDLKQTNTIDTNTYGTTLDLTVGVTDNGNPVASSTQTILVQLFNFPTANISLDPNIANTLASTTSGVARLIFDTSNRLSIGGQAIVSGGSIYYGVARLTSNQLPDSTFNSPVTATPQVRAMIIQSDGKVILGGSNMNVGAYSNVNLIRLNSDGTLDTSFMSNIGTGPSGPVWGLGLYNNQIIVEGQFASFNGTTTPRLIRLNQDGTIDNSFLSNIGTGITGLASLGSITTQGGKIIISGNFTSFNGHSSKFVVRLNGDGTYDSTFSPVGSGFNGVPTASGVLSNGDVVLIGSFTSYNGSSTPGIALLNSDGSLNTTFTNNSLTYQSGSNPLLVPNQIAVSPNDQILVVGNANSGALPLARINSDGTLDNYFSQNIGSGPNGNTSAIGLRNDGAIAIDGSFTSFNGQSDGNIALITTTTPAAPSAPNLQAGSSTGAFVSNGSTNTSTIYYSGIAAPGATVYISDGNNSIATTTANNTGNYQGTTTLATGSHNINAYQVLTVTTTATSTNSSSTSLNIDTTPPTVSGTPTVNGSTITIQYSQPISTIFSLVSAWQVLDNGISDPVFSATSSGSTITLTLTNTVNHPDIVTLTYNGSSTISDMAGNSAPTFSSLQLNNTTTTVPPTIINPRVSNLSDDAVTLTATISNDGYASSTIDGFNYGASNLYGMTSSNSGTFGVGDFTENISSLSPGTTYHYQAFATNSSGTGVSNDETFTTDTAPTSVATTVAIGGSLGPDYLWPSNSNSSINSTSTTEVPNCPPGYICVKNPVSVVNTFSVFTRDLFYGLRGSDVLSLQNILIAEGYLEAEYNTGYFGPLTRTALIKYQKSNDISPSIGYFGPITRAFMQSH